MITQVRGKPGIPNATLRFKAVPITARVWSAGEHGTHPEAASVKVHTVGREQALSGTRKPDWKVIGEASAERLSFMEKTPDGILQLKQEALDHAKKGTAPFVFTNELITATRLYAERCAAVTAEREKAAADTSTKLTALAAARVELRKNKNKSAKA
jgi:hypothetical protein